MSAIIIQGSPEWFAERAGRATASEFETVLKEGRTKGTPSIQRQKYALQLALERITGTVAENGDFAATRHGTETEPYARMRYEAYSGNIVEEVGFIRHPILMAGSSPDGLIDSDGGLEIKCPHNREVHALTILQGMPKEHTGQVQGNMWITGRKWWDFVSFNPSMPDHLQLYVQRIERDEEYIANLEEKIKTFLGEVEALVQQFQKRAA